MADAFGWSMQQISELTPQQIAGIMSANVESNTRSVPYNEYKRLKKNGI